MIQPEHIARHRRQLLAFLGSDDPLACEAALLDASELAKQLVAHGATTDDMLGLHQQAQAGLADDGDTPDALRRQLARGDALPMMTAILLPQQLAEQARAARLEEGIRQNDKLRAVATLAAGIAHDFNNLLGSIIGLAELCALQADPGTAQARNLGGIQQAARRAAELTDQLLNFAREQPPRLRPLSLRALLHDCQALWAAVLPLGVDLALQAEVDAQVMADAGQIEQVLLNLVKNAGDAVRTQHRKSASISTAEIRLTLDLARRDGQPQDWARIRVIDHGCGIAPELLPRLFEPFFTTKPVGEGTGLGLAAAHGIVQQHGGLLEATSVAGGATTFSLWLPLDADAQAMPHGRAVGALARR